MKRLALLHTVPFLVDVFKPKLASRLPGLEFFNIVDESLFKDFTRQGGLNPAIIRRVVAQASLAVSAGAEVILFTCTSTSPAVDVARQLIEEPIIKIDDPLAAKAVSLASRIGLVCTAQSTLEPSQKLLAAHAARQGKAITVTPRLEAAAMQALLAGDRARHDELVQKAAAELAGQVEVVVLAQASMAHLAPALDGKLPVPVLASPDLAVEEVARLVGA